MISNALSTSQTINGMPAVRPAGLRKPSTSQKIMDKIIYSFFDFSGEWSKPYRKAGYIVIQIDKKLGIDIRDVEIPSVPVYGILGAPECTHFAVSGAQYWKAKDADGRTEQGLIPIRLFLSFVYKTEPVFWCMENPVGRLPKLLSYILGKPIMYFDPCDYGDPYTKRTCLWGKFNPPLKHPVEPIRVCSQGSWVQRYGGKSEYTKTARAKTPAGFANAFFLANQ